MLRTRMLAFTFGVKQMIYFCNKMDASIPKYSNFSFDGNNIIERSADLGWYKGSSLLDALDKANELKSRSDKAPRFPLQDFTGFVVLELFQLLFVKIGAKPSLVPTFGISSCGQYWVRH